MDANEVKKVIEALHSFDALSTPSVFTDVFGHQLGAHLWSKYATTHKGNILYLWGHMDNWSRSLLVKYIIEGVSNEST